MEKEIKIPNVGESVQEAVLVQWYKNDGDPVQKDEPIFVVETDKVTLEIVAEASGILKILISEGQTVAIGAVVGSIDVKEASEAEPEPSPAVEEPELVPPEEKKETPHEVPKKPEKPVPPKAAPEKAAAEKVAAEKKPAEVRKNLSPSVRRLVSEKNIDIADIIGTGPGNRITKGDVLLYLEQTPSAPPVSLPTAPEAKDAAPVTPETSDKTTPSRMEDVTRKPMSPIRRTIASRLLEAKHSTAMLTTFNEIDMTHTMALRSQF